MRVCGAAFLLFVTACAPRVLLGEPCIYASDCPAPLSCLAGRCRNECVTSRDCPPALECVNVGGSVTACRVPQDDGCAGDDGCTAPLRCIDGSCVEACTDSNTCVTENVCDEGTCVPVPPLMIGGCSPVGVTSGCAAGDACVRTGAEYACAPAAGTPVPVGARCTSQGQCGPGTSCANGRCVRLCVTASPSCGPGSRCTDDTLFGLPDEAAVRGPAPPEGLGYCTEVCDPLARSGATGCLPGNTCAIVVPGDGQFYYYCRALVEPALATNDVCDVAMIDDDRCPEGTLCTSFGESDRTCYAYCDLDSPTACGGGRTCVPVEPIAGDPFGLCRLPD